MNKFYRQVIRFIVITLLTLTLALIWSPNSWGQISLFTTQNNNQPTESPPWDLNKAYVCGQFWCSNVYIYDDSTHIETSLLNPELILTASKNLDESNFEVAQKVEKRAKQVQRIFEEIFENIVDWNTLSEVPYIEDWQFWFPTTVKPLHPWTPKIEIGIRNKQTVIYAPEQPELGLSAQVIVTVNSIDVQASPTTLTVEELAEAWQSKIRLAFSNALWGYELDRQHPEWRWGISGAIIAITIVLIWLIHLIRSFLRKWNNQLRRKLNELTDFMAVDPEATSHPKEKSDIKTEDSSKQNVNLQTHNQFKILHRLISSFRKTVSFCLLIKTKLLNFIKRIARKYKWIASTYHISREKLFLKRQTIIKQKQNFCQLLIRLMFILGILIFAFSLVLIVVIFRQTRFLSIYLIKETLIIIILWTSLIFVDKLGDFAIDYFLNRWASEAQIVNPSSNRYTLRVNTYSTTLKQATTFLSIILGIYLSIWLIGINPSVLAGAGILTVALAFLGRSLIEDMLNGILILWTDRYAIDDVIDLGGGMSGAVEDINLFITSLRNLDGQLIAIPNSKISSVINNTKYWSRVNFTIKIAWDEDINQAIDIMTQVAAKMQSEPEWGEKFLEPAEILGVDEVSNEGILIHLIIKTQPKEQWSLGREFRLRVKQALDEAGISLGIPHYKISVIHSQKDKNDQLLVNVISQQD